MITESSGEYIDLLMFINMGEGKIYFSGDHFSKNSTIEKFPLNKNEAFHDTLMLVEGPIFISFATMGQFKNMKILNVY